MAPSDTTAAQDSTTGQIDRDALVAYLDRYLEAGASGDYCPNGLQVEGKATVRRLITAVSACRELFERAVEAGADALLVHHGIFWRGDDRRLTGVQYRRVKTLLSADLNLIAYHLPLDRHGVVGNNAVAARRLGIEELVPFAEAEGQPIGWAGRFGEPRTPQQLVADCQRLYRQEPVAFLGGPPEVRSAAIISGSAEREVHRALAGGYDAFITGEATEWVMNLTREAGIHYLACGHYATERLGVQALGDHIAERFGIEVTYVDIPNPV